MIILALMIKIPTRPRIRKTMRILCAETETGFFSALFDAEEETGEACDGGDEGEAEDEGLGEAVEGPWCGGVEG